MAGNFKVIMYIHIISDNDPVKDDGLEKEQDNGLNKEHEVEQQEQQEEAEQQEQQEKEEEEQQIGFSNEFDDPIPFSSG